MNGVYETYLFIDKGFWNCGLLPTFSEAFFMHLLNQKVMPYFIECFKSSFTNNISYSTRPRELVYMKRALQLTSETFHLKTIAVLKFDSMIEKNGIYWLLGLRRLQPVPHLYKIPPLYFLKGTIAPKAVIRYEAPIKRITTEVKAKVAGQLF